MNYIVTAPKTINATITLPASKSISNRALVIHQLSNSKVLPDNLSDCDDTEVMIRALQTIRESRVESRGSRVEGRESRVSTIDIGAAGTSMRFMTALLSAFPEEHEYLLTGTERMKHRPIGILVNALRALGADIRYAGEEGFPPLLIHSRPLEGGRLEVPGNTSSQYISALLMIGPALRNGLELRLTGKIVSRPYIDLTLHVMHEFGNNVEWTGVDTISVAPQPYKERHYTIENDWSAASYWYEILALTTDYGAQVVLPGLHDSSRQGDSVVRYLFSLLGVKTEFKDDNVILKRKPCTMQHMQYDFSNQPDLAQTVVVACCALGIKFHFTGLSTLKIKETDRIEALKTELKKLGFVIHDANDSELIWDGQRCEAEADPAIDTYEDHRMAMAFAPLAMVFDKMRINDPQVVSKSYPHFWNDLEQAGFEIIHNL